jgi:predicted DCC family thiol-disulfide oxidoreductase YuxK
MSALPNFLDGPTYVPVRMHSETAWFDETRASSSLKDAVEDIDNLEAVILIEGGKVIDVSVEAAQLWYTLNRDDIDTVFDIPAFIHEQIHNEVYDDICASRYEANAYADHTRAGWGGRL